MAKLRKVSPYTPQKLPQHFPISPELQTLLSDAADALCSYNSLLKKMKNPEADLEKFIWEEAIATTHLNGSQLTPEKAMHYPQNNPLVHDSVRAFAIACKQAPKPFSKKLLCTLHAAIKKHTATPYSDLGRYRTRQNWIGPKGCTRNEAYFLPPSPKCIGSAMRQWVAYSNRETDEPLLQLAQLVAQLLIIHPFMDGNGRIARMIIPLFLYQNGLLAAPYFFLSTSIQKHRLAYLRTLYDITAEDNWQNWTLFFLKALRDAALIHCAAPAK